MEAKEIARELIVGVMASIVGAGLFAIITRIVPLINKVGLVVVIIVLVLLVVGVFHFRVDRKKLSRRLARKYWWIRPSIVFKEYGIVSPLAINNKRKHSFREIRKFMIENSTGEIIITGQSLKDAFSQEKENENSILESLENVIQDGKVNKLTIYLSDPCMFDKCENESMGRNTNPVQWVSKTIDTVALKIARDLGQKYRIDVYLYLLPLLQLDHMVFSGDVLLLRYTLLWTQTGEYKSVPLLCFENNKSEKDSKSEKNVVQIHKNYLEFLRKRCTEIGKDEIQELCSGDVCKVVESGRLHIHRLYRSKLVSSAYETWSASRRNITFKAGLYITQEVDLYNSKNTFADDLASKVLLPYVKETQAIFTKVIKKYDTNGCAEIFPAYDIGFPNNAMRLSGGFATGMMVGWKSDVPIVPVDTTVNVCSCSMFEISTSDIEEIKTAFCSTRINEVVNEASLENSVVFNFINGNHFAMIMKETNGKYYLVLHSSAQQFKDTYMGLYPTSKSFFSSHIKTYEPENSVNNGGKRYFRYLVGETASFFISFARLLNRQNEEIHATFASKLFGDKQHHIKTWHHYGMPEENIITIGAYLVSENEETPIFTHEGQPIFTFAPNADMWGIEISGTKKYLIPHGWGQSLSKEITSRVEADDGINLIYNSSDRQLHLKGNTRDEPLKENGKGSIKENCEVRNLWEHISTAIDVAFIENEIKRRRYLCGRVERVLYPVLLYSDSTGGGVKSYE